MIKDFWNTKLNPVTMWPKEINFISQRTGKNIKTDKNYQYAKHDLSKDPEYITSKDAVKKIGFGAKKINSYIRSFGNEISSFRYGQLMYYKVSDVETLISFLKDKSNEKDNIVPEEYISSSDLKIVLKLDTMQLYTLVHKNRWKGRKFKGKGNKMFYLRQQVLNKC